MIVRYTRRALADLAEARAYIARDRPAAARHVVERIREATARLADHPGIGRFGRVAGTRELIVSGLPYIVAYRVTGEDVDVLSIVHAAQRWPASFEERR